MTDVSPETIEGLREIAEWFREMADHDVTVRLAPSDAASMSRILDSVASYLAAVRPDELTTAEVQYSAFLDGKQVGVGTTDRFETAESDVEAWVGAGYDAVLMTRTVGEWREIDAPHCAHHEAAGQS